MQYGVCDVTVYKKRINNRYIIFTDGGSVLWAIDELFTDTNTNSTSTHFA